MTDQPDTTSSGPGSSGAPSAGPFTPWPALGAFGLSVALTWSVGSVLQTRHLPLGLLLTEILFFAGPAWLVLACQPVLRRGGPVGQASRLSSQANPVLSNCSCQPKSDPSPESPVRRDGLPEKTGGTPVLPCRPASLLPGTASPFRRPAPRRLWQTTLLALPVIGLAVAKGLTVREALEVPLPSEDLAWPVALVVAFVAPFCEELLFRPLLQGALARVWKPRNAILATALLFGLVHGSGVRFGETFVLGLFTGVVFHKTGSYWACVLFHILSNTLGPALFVRAATLGWLANPFVALALAVIAVWLAGRLGPPAPLDLGGWRALIGWRLFGGGQAARASARRRPSFIATYWGLVAAMTVLVTLATKAELQSRPPPPPPTLRATQSDTWVLRTDDMIACESRIELAGEAVPPRDFRLALPYPEARITAVRLGVENARWRMTYLDLFEVILPEGVPADTLPMLVIEWDLPIVALDREARGYTARLQALLPVMRYRLELLLPPDSPWQLGSDPSVHRTTLFSIDDPGTRPRHFFGTCGIRLRKRVAGAEIVQ